MFYKKITLAFLLVFQLKIIFAQNSQLVQILERFTSIKTLSSDTAIITHLNDLDSLLCYFFSKTENFNYENNELNKYLKKLTSKDKKMSVYTFSVMLPESFELLIFGYIQFKINNEFYFVKLTDSSEKYNYGELVDLNENKWFGAVYYEIIDLKDEFGKYYVLLGFNGKNILYNQKVIEVLRITETGLKWGYNFLVDGRTYKRLIFRYNKKAKMLLTWDNKQKRIVFDHLSPSEPRYVGVFQFYGPDFSYDALYFENHKLVFKSNVYVEAPK